jgi:hypothetical protein
MDIKICTKCNKELEAITENFHRMKSGKYGFRPTCKSCVRVYRKEYTSTDKFKEKNRKNAAKWRKENPEKALEVSRESYKNNGHKHNAKRREQYRTDPEFKAKVVALEKKYKESGRRYEMNSKPEQMEKSRKRSKTRRENKELREKDYLRNARYRKENKEYLHKLHLSNRKDLKPSYVAQTLRISVKDLTPSIYETKRIIIKLKRELKQNNVKIR